MSWLAPHRPSLRISAAISGVSGAPAQSTTWFRRQVAYRIHQVRYAFLARDAAHEQHVRNRRIDAIFHQRSGFAGLLVFVESIPL